MQKQWGIGQYLDIKGRLKYDLFNSKSTQFFYDQAVKKGLNTADFNKFISNSISDMEKLEARGSLMGRFYSGLSKLDAFSTWASIGAGAGVLLGTVLGFDTVVGAAVVGTAAGLTGLGLRTLIDNTRFGQTAMQGLTNSSLMKFPFMKFLAEIPTNELMSIYSTNLWWGEQLDMIKNRYHGNFGEYWKDNWDMFNDPSLLKSFSVLSNMLTLGTSLLTIANPLVANMMFHMIEPLIHRGIAGVWLPVSAAGATAGAIVGTAAGIAIAMMLGVPLGAGMILGATIGGLIGMGVGIAVATALDLASFGWAFVITVPIATGLSAIGAWIGSLFDKTVGFTGAFFVNFLMGMMAIFQMLSLLQQQVTLDNSFSMAIGLVSLLSTIYKMGVLDTSNQCVDKSRCPTPNSTSLYEPQITNLSAYDVNIIKTSNMDINSNTMQIISSYLDENLSKLSSQFSGKTIYFNLATNTSYVSDSFVIIGVEQDKIISTETIKTAIDQTLTKIDDSTFSISNSTKTSFLNVAN